MSHEFFQNRSCEYFPCHPTEDRASFNCLFCFCPLYALGRDCGGNCRYTKDGVKDCSHCTIPHSPDAYTYIVDRFPKLKELAKEK